MRFPLDYFQSKLESALNIQVKTSRFDTYQLSQIHNFVYSQTKHHQKIVSTQVQTSIVHNTFEVYDQSKTLNQIISSLHD